MENQEYVLHPSVFYRKFDEDVILYQTAQGKVYRFNATANDILNCFRANNPLNGAINTLKSIYDIDIENSESFEKGLRAFIGELIAKDILVPVFHEKENANHLELRVARGFVGKGKLLSATFELTYRCNENCKHCFITDEDRPEMTTSKIKKQLDELREMNVLNLTFTGGEVFLRPDIFEILEYAYSNNFLIDIFTNGTLLESDDFFRLKSIWPRCVNFSVYSHDAVKHDDITRSAGSFEKTIAAIKKCVAIGIPVNIKTPIFKHTITDMPDIIALAESFTATIQLGMVIVPKKDGDLSPTILSVDNANDLEKIIDAGETYFENVRSDSAELERTDKICSAGEYSISINPYGDVFPCNTLQLNLGNVYEQSIKEIWEESEVLREWRKANSHGNKKGCEDCEILGACVFCPGEALMRTGDHLKKYEAACTLTKSWVEHKKRVGRERR